MALRIHQVEEIQRLLRRTSEIVDDFHSATYVDRVVEWLSEAERMLESNRLHDVSMVAQSRAMLAASRRGMPPPDLVVEGRRTPRKVAQGAACRALSDGIQILNGAIGRRCDELQEAEGMARQIIAVARVKGYVPEAPVLSQSELQALRARISSDEDLLPYFVRLTGLVTNDDALVLLDRAR